ncbi:hypothetical protein ACJKRE_08285 [Rickettsia amblyommatis]
MELIIIQYILQNTLLTPRLPLDQFLLIPPGWSIGLEIAFYLMAPWILKKKNIYILSIICISLITRIILQFNGFIGDSWSYRFFPSELAVFLIGSQAFYIYTKFKK